MRKPGTSYYRRGAAEDENGSVSPWSFNSSLSGCVQFFLDPLGQENLDERLIRNFLHSSSQVFRPRRFISRAEITRISLPLLVAGWFQPGGFGLEPTSVYHKPLAEHLIEQGHLVVYATNEAIKKNRSPIDGRWDKNDTKDSANVADLVAQGKCHYYDLPDQRLRDLRSLLLLRKRLKKQVHSCRVRIRNNLVAQYFPELDLSWHRFLTSNIKGVPTAGC